MKLVEVTYSVTFKVLLPKNDCFSGVCQTFYFSIDIKSYMRCYYTPHKHSFLGIYESRVHPSIDLSVCLSNCLISATSPWSMNGYWWNTTQMQYTPCAGRRIILVRNILRELIEITYSYTQVVYIFFMTEPLANLKIFPECVSCKFMQIHVCLCFQHPISIEVNEKYVYW